MISRSARRREAHARLSLAHSRRSSVPANCQQTLADLPFLIRPWKVRSVRVADYPGMIGKGYADLRHLPQEEPASGSFGNWTVIASDLEVDPCRRYDLEKGSTVATNLRRRQQQISR